MSGSIIKWWWNGTNYDVKSSADFTENPESELEGIATSGKTLFKEEKQVATVESVELIADAVAQQLLRDDARAKVIANMGYKEEDGTVKNATGRLKLEQRATMESTFTVQMIPQGTWEITPP